MSYNKSLELFNSIQVEHRTLIKGHLYANDRPRLGEVCAVGLLAMHSEAFIAAFNEYGYVSLHSIRCHLLNKYQLESHEVSSIMKENDDSNESHVLNGYERFRQVVQFMKSELQRENVK